MDVITKENTSSHEIPPVEEAEQNFSENTSYAALSNVPLTGVFAQNFPASQSNADTSCVKVKKRGRPKGSKNKPKSKKVEIVEKDSADDQAKDDDSSDDDDEVAVTDPENDFTDDAVIELVKLVGQKKRKKGSATKMFPEIAQMMTNQGFQVTPNGCRRKFNKLNNRYKLVKDNNRQTGRSPLHFKFEETFDEVFGESEGPVTLIDSSIGEAVEAAGRRPRPERRTPTTVNRPQAPPGLEGMRGCEERKVAILEQMFKLKQEKWEHEKQILNERWQLEKQLLIKKLNK